MLQCLLLVQKYPNTIIIFSASHWFGWILVVDSSGSRLEPALATKFQLELVFMKTTASKPVQFYKVYRNTQLFIQTWAVHSNTRLWFFLVHIINLNIHTVGIWNSKGVGILRANLLRISSINKAMLVNLLVMSQFSDILCTSIGMAMWPFMATPHFKETEVAIAQVLQFTQKVQR